MAGAIRILFITYDFPPVNHSGTFRSEAFVKYLPGYGIVPTVVCSATALDTVPTYVQSDSEYTHCRANVDIIRINWRHRPPLYRSISAFLLKLPVINSLTRLFDHNFYLKKNAMEIIRKTKDCKHLAIYASSPPSDTILIAKHISRLLKLPLICDLRDPWTYFPAAKYRSYVDFVIERQLEKSILNSAFQVIANTQASKLQLIQEIGVEAHKIIVIPNGFDNINFTNSIGTKELDKKKFNITYTGLISPSAKKLHHGLRTTIKKILGLDYFPVSVDHTTRSPRYFLKALGLLIESEPSLIDTVQFHLVGKFDPELLGEIAQFQFKDCIQVHGPLSQVDANKFCMDSDLLLLLQISTKISGRSVCTAVPGKIFNYLRSGTRILAVMEENEAAEIIRYHAAGDVVPPSDVEAIAQILRRSIDYWKKHGEKEPGPVYSDIEMWDRRILTSKLAERITASIH